MRPTFTRILADALALAALALPSCLPLRAHAAEALIPLSLQNVQVDGEIGRRITVTITNSLLVLDADRDFLPPFQARTNQGGCIGILPLLACLTLVFCVGHVR